MRGPKNGKTHNPNKPPAPAPAPVRLPAPAASGRKSNGLLLLVGLLGAGLAVLFYEAFEARQVLFANDGPLGAWIAESNRFPGRFFGRWLTTEWIGLQAPSSAPSLTNILAMFLPAILYFKIYAPLTLLFLGFSAWVFFREQGFNPMVCVIGGLAAGLNMHFFSTACWGLGGWNMSAGLTFLALAALTTKSIPQFGARAVLAGLAVGLNLMEGFDVGAILSIYVGVFVVFQALSEETGLLRKALTAVGTEVLVVFFAGFIAAHTITSLIGTQVEDVVSAQQDESTKERQWNRDTQWSLPKVETLRIITPGIFGYRLQQYITDADKSGAYWGCVGQDPRIPAMKSDDPAVREEVIKGFNPPLEPEQLAGLRSPDRPTRLAQADQIKSHLGMFARHEGSGEYAGVLVGVLAIFAFANVFRSLNSPYTPFERRRVWFWSLAAIFSMLAAWGRHGFVYQILYKLPYFSTIRNPIKFLHPFNLLWLILAGYGLEILQRRYLQAPLKRADFLPDHIKTWWGKAANFEKKWAAASGLAIGLAILGLVIRISQKNAVESYMVYIGFKIEAAEKMAGFSIRETLWFIAFLTASVGAFLAILSGAWSGIRVKSAWIALIAILVLDLARTDRPWVHFYDYQEKYAANPVLNFLLQHPPYEQRIMGRLSPRGPGSANAVNGAGFGSVYDFWMQNDFPYHNIQTLDFAQMPRMPAMDDAYLHNLQLVGSSITNADLHPAVRLWELTGTRYLFLDTKGVGLLNEHGDPEHHAFHILAQLKLNRKEGVDHIEDPGDVTVEQVDQGPTAVIEFDRALPRAKLYSNWQIPTNGPETLEILRSLSFDCTKTVLLWTNSDVPAIPPSPNADPGTVEIAAYRSKYIKLQAAAKTPAVLLLNDRWAKDWSVTVDQKPAPVLRCNYIMRGVFLTPGDHTIEFRFHPSVRPLYVSLAGWASGLLVAGYVIAGRRKQKSGPVQVKQ